MTSMTVQLRTMPGTSAAIGRAGSHTVVVDRPAGTAGGQGLGFNGGQLLALAIGGCFCNDLQYVAHDMGIILRNIDVTVTVHFEGNPQLASGADLVVSVDPESENADASALIERARLTSTVSNSLQRGVPVSIRS